MKNQVKRMVLKIKTCNEFENSMENIDFLEKSR